MTAETRSQGTPRLSLRLASDIAVFLIVAIPATVLSYRLFGAGIYSATFAIELSGLVFFLVRHLMGPRTYVGFKVRVDTIVVALATLAILGSIFTVALKGASPYYSLFSGISPVTYLGYLFAVSLTDFLPGFLALSALNSGKRLGFLGNLVFSYVLSFFISSSLASVLLLSGFGLTQSFLYLGGINIALSVAALLSVRSSDRQHWEVKVDDGVLSFGFLLALVGSMYYFIDLASNIPFLKEDLLLQFGNALRYLLPGWQFTFAHLSYPPWFFWNLAILMNQSGFPLINAAVATAPLALFMVVAIAYAAKVISKDRSIMILAAVAFTLLGSSLWVLSALHVPNPTTRALPGFTIPYETWDFKDYMVGLTCTIALIGLLYERNNLGWKTKSLLIVASLDSAFLAHILEPVFFVAAALPVYLIMSGSGLRDKSLYGLSVLAALGIAILIGLTVGISVIVTAAEYLFGLTALVLVLAFGVNAAASRARRESGLFRSLTRIGSAGYRLAIYVLICFYGLSIAAFIVFPSINMNLANWYYGVVPLSEYWVLLGITAPVILLGLALISRLKTELPSWLIFAAGFAFLALLAISAIGFLNTYPFIRIGLGSGNFVGVPTGLLPWRIVVILLVPMSLLFGFVVLTMTTFLGRYRGRKYILPLFITALIILGIPSTFVQARYYVGDSGEIGAQYVPAELNAMNFMVHSIPLDSSVLALTSAGSMLVTASAKFNQPLDNFSTTIMEPFILGSRDPALVMGLLSKYNVSYIFVDQRDKSPLSAYKTGFLLSQLLPRLTVAFNDSNNVIYSVPHIFPPSTGQNIDMVSPLATTNDYGSESTLLSLFQSYSSLSYGAMPQESGLTVFPYDPQPRIDANDLSLFSVSPSSGDRLSNNSQYISWSLDLSKPGIHNLTMSLETYQAVSDIKSISITMGTSTPKLACNVEAIANGAPHQVLSFFSTNRTISAAIPSAISSTLDAILLSCGDPSRTISSAVMSVKAVQLITYQDSSEQAVSGLYPQQQGNLSNYIQWATNGGKLLVLDPGLPSGFFAQYLSLREGQSVNLSGIEVGSASPMPINSTSGRAIAQPPGTAVLISYATSAGTAGTVPLLLEKQVGTGTIYWAQLGPLLSLMNRHLISLSQAASLFRLIIAEVSPGSGTVSSPQPLFESILRGNITLAGQNTVSGSEVLPLLTNHQFTITSTDSGTSTGFAVSRIYGNGLAWTANSSRAEVVPATTSGLSEITYPTGATFVLNSSPGSFIVISGVKNGATATTNLTVSSPARLTTSTSVSLFAASPTITLSGVLSSSGIMVTQQFYAKVGQPYGLSLEHPYTSFSVRGDMTIHGVSFGDALMVDNLSGKWQAVDPNPVSSWQMTTTEWAQLVVPPLGAVAILAVVAVVLLDLALRSRNSARENRSG